MSKIYKIINDINDKVYVGKTTSTIENRFKEHCADRNRREMENRPLYRAMNKHGVEHFSIHLIEECPNDQENERESYWIGYYKGYEEGYNATRGGEGKCLYDHEKIFELLQQGKNSKEISAIIGCSSDVVYEVAKANNFSISYQNEYAKQLEQSKKRVAQYDLQGNFIQSFDSYADAARWLVENGKAKTLNGGVRGHIGDVCKGVRKSAYKYLWKDLD